MTVDEPSVLRAGVPPGHVELWFDFGSTYSYLAVMRIDHLAASRDVGVVWRPFLLGPIFKELGWQGSPFLEQKEKLAYMWRDVERECAKFELEWRRPSVFPRAAVLPSRVALSCAQEPWIGEFCRAVMLQNFVADREIDAAEAVQDALQSLGLPAPGILERAGSDANRLALRSQTQRARALGIFGAPTVLVGDEMFWGNDRLEDALNLAAKRASAVPADVAPNDA